LAGARRPFEQVTSPVGYPAVGIPLPRATKRAHVIEDRLYGRVRECQAFRASFCAARGPSPTVTPNVNANPLAGALVVGASGVEQGADWPMGTSEGHERQRLRLVRPCVLGLETLLCHPDWAPSCPEEVRTESGRKAVGVLLAIADDAKRPREP